MDLASWSYQVEGSGPGCPPNRAVALPSDAAIVRARLTYGWPAPRRRPTGSSTSPSSRRGGGWLLAGDTDGDSSGLETERDLWDLGPGP